MSLKTPFHGHAPIEMRRMPGDAPFGERDDLPALGAFRWRAVDGRRVLQVMIPCRSKAGRTFSEWTIDHKNGSGAQWSWDGNVNKPTLTPSLHAVNIWHGHVTAGQLIEAGAGKQPRGGPR